MRVTYDISIGKKEREAPKKRRHGDKQRQYTARLGPQEDHTPSEPSETIPGSREESTHPRRDDLSGGDIAGPINELVRLLDHDVHGCLWLA